MKKSTKKLLYRFDWLAVFLLIAGGLNWGLIGFFNYDLVADILPSLAKVVYSAVGLGSVWILGRSIMNGFMKK